MAFAFVAAASNGVGATAGTTIVVTITPGAGNMVVCHCTWGSATTTDLTSITDNGTGGTWVIPAALRIADGGNGQSGGSAYGYGWSVSPTTITMTTASLDYRGMTCIAFSGQLAGDPIDGTNLQGQLDTTVSGTTESGAGTKTPSANNHLVFVGSVNTGNVGGGGSEYSAGANFTEPVGAEYSASNQISFSSEYWIQTTATATNGPFTVTQNTNHVTNMLMFKIASAGDTLFAQSVM